MHWRSFIFRRRSIVTYSFISILIFIILIAKNRPTQDYIQNEYLPKESQVIKAEAQYIEPTGPGEAGKPYNYATNDRQNGFKEYGINMAASNIISLDRTVLDTRNEECQTRSYPTELPKTSVIIVFHNEGFSVLARTVHSVINRSPANILHEVILVDDLSNKVDLKQKLDDHITIWNGKVKIVRNAERMGLIQARTNGARVATGEVIVFLDAHCEVNINWLPPLIHPILEDHTTLTVPIIDGIDKMTFAYKPVYNKLDRICGIFEWGFYYKETHITERELRKHKSVTEPYNCPTNAGGLFAMNRKYFFHLGGYDPGLLAWGGENFELSFKIWQCGGNIKWVPCSHVGHIYRPARYNYKELVDKRRGSLTIGNYRRVIETWFDEEHKQFFYTRDPLAAYVEMGDITKQKQLKEDLKCKDFKWFMENVAYDIYAQFPKLPPNKYWGSFKSASNNLCLDTLGYDAPANVGMSGCHGTTNNQVFRLNTEGQLGVGERCVDVSDFKVKILTCPKGSVSGLWEYDEYTHQLKYNKSKCLAEVDRAVILQTCRSTILSQQWIIKKGVAGKT